MNIKEEYKGKNIHMKDRTIIVDDIKSTAEAKRLGVEFILEPKEGKKSKKAAEESSEEEKGEQQ